MSDSPLLPFAFKFGLGVVFLMVIHSLLLFIFDVQDVTWLQYISYVIVIAGLIGAIKAYRDDQHGGSISYGQAVGAGTMISLVFSVFFGIYTYIFVKFIDPAVVDKIMERTEEAMIQQGQSDEAIETALRWTKAMTTPFMMAMWSIITYFVVGFIVSLIASAFLKKKKQTGYST